MKDSGQTLNVQFTWNHLVQPETPSGSGFWISLVVSFVRSWTGDPRQKKATASEANTKILQTEIWNELKDTGVWYGGSGWQNVPDRDKSKLLVRDRLSTGRQVHTGNPDPNPAGQSGVQRSGLGQGQDHPTGEDTGRGQG